MEKGWIYWYLAADKRVFALLKKFRFAINALGEALEYLGSPTIPAFINIRAGIWALEIEDPELAAFLMYNVRLPRFAWYEFQAVS
jgi:hypothetical protein